MTKSNILIVGQGSIGEAVTNRLSEQGLLVTGLARQPRAHYKLPSDAGFIQADAKALTAEQLAVFTHIAIIVTPDSYDADHYRDTYLGIAEHIASFADTLPNLQRIVFISSTGVYGQDNGEWIDENTVPNIPKRAGSQYILQAEQALTQAYGKRAVMIRPSGIYGKNRRMRINKAQESLKEPMSLQSWTNRIMDTDLVTIINRVLTISNDDIKPVYLATDYQPVTSYDLTFWLSKQLNSTLPMLEVGESDNDGSKSKDSVASGKRLHSNIPLEWLEFADWQAGYRAILGQSLALNQ